MNPINEIEKSFVSFVLSNILVENLNNTLI